MCTRQCIVLNCVGWRHSLRLKVVGSNTRNTNGSVTGLVKGDLNLAYFRVQIIIHLKAGKGMAFNHMVVGSNPTGGI